MSLAVLRAVPCYRMGYAAFHFILSDCYTRISLYIGTGFQYLLYSRQRYEDLNSQMESLCISGELAYSQITDKGSDDR